MVQMANSHSQGVGSITGLGQLCHSKLQLDHLLDLLLAAPAIVCDKLFDLSWHIAGYR